MVYAQGSIKRISLITINCIPCSNVLIRWKCYSGRYDWVKLINVTLARSSRSDRSLPVLWRQDDVIRQQLNMIRSFTFLSEPAHKLLFKPPAEMMPLGGIGASKQASRDRDRPCDVFNASNVTNMTLMRTNLTYLSILHHCCKSEARVGIKHGANTYIH